MLVCKDGVRDVNSDLFVDNWETNYEENPTTGNIELIENVSGLVKTDEQTFLGLVISSKGDDMDNLNQMNQKSFPIVF